MSSTPNSLEAVDVKEMDTTKQIEVSSGEFTWTPEEEKALVRKIDLFLLPTIWLMYLLSYMDRTKYVTHDEYGCSSLTGSQHWQCKDCWYGNGFAPHVRPILYLSGRFLRHICRLRTAIQHASRPLQAFRLSPHHHDHLGRTDLCHGQD